MSGYLRAQEIVKYNNTKTVVDGITFDSKKEAKRYGELKLLESAGKISALKLQVVFVLSPSVVIAKRKRPALKYVADFTYIENGSHVIEDCKGMLTPVYRLKRHLMYAAGFSILET
jgi:hypothetical protein